jgi:hypothetical protein
MSQGSQGYYECGHHDLNAQDRLIEKASLIQEWFEREEAALQQKQAWYQQNQVSIRSDVLLPHVEGKATT